MLNILVLCTGNSARSIIAECLLNQYGQGQFHAYSAGSHPVGRVNPFAVAALTDAGIAAVGVRSKSWDAFAQPGGPLLDLVITVCDNAAGETCPFFNFGGQEPAKVHWSYPDPAAVTGTDAEKRAAFMVLLKQMTSRIHKLVTLDHLKQLKTLPSAERARLVQAIPG